MNDLSDIGKKTVTFFYQVDYSNSIKTLVGFSTRGRRQTMDGPNYDLFQDIVNNLTPMDSVIQSKVDVKNDPQYFKVKTVTLSGQDRPFPIYCTNYLVTNRIRTVGITVIHYGKEDSDLESSIQNLNMY